jgi:hypothetical protein
MEVIIFHMSFLNSHFPFLTNFKAEFESGLALNHTMFPTNEKRELRNDIWKMILFP